MLFLAPVGPKTGLIGVGAVLGMSWAVLGCLRRSRSVYGPFVRLVDPLRWGGVVSFRVALLWRCGLKCWPECWLEYWFGLALQGLSFGGAGWLKVASQAAGTVVFVLGPCLSSGFSRARGAAGAVAGGFGRLFVSLCLVRSSLGRYVAESVRLRAEILRNSLFSLRSAKFIALITRDPR